MNIQALALSSWGAAPCRESFLIGKMPTRLFACSAACADPDYGLHVTVLDPPRVRVRASPLSLTRSPTKSLWKRINFSFPCRTYRSSVKAVMRLHPSIAEPKRSAFTLTPVLQACRRFFGVPVYLFVQERGGGKGRKSALLLEFIFQHQTFCGPLSRLSAGPSASV